KNPAEALKHAVLRMLPKNYLQKGMIKRLIIN
ncbi:uL13 family ribosomal protein, partial [Candidatus Uhrbacteria bacterium]|nr:uL13 family ribosomal protein [Candidatus Uhrbacteria bacterium]